MSARLGVAVALILVALPAMAEDLRFQDDFAPAWDGVYGGIFASHNITSLHVKLPGAVDFNGIAGESAFGGLLLGFNHRFSERVVGGAEIDGALADGESHFNVSDTSGDYFNSSITGDWGVSAKGRIGYLVAPGTLFYAYAGALVAEASYGCTSSVIDCPPRMQETLYGFPFIGFGAETEAWHDWRVRLEYEAELLPTLSFGNDPSVDVTPLSGTAKLALIHDFAPPGHGTQTTAGFGYAPKTWTGFYAGGEAGFSMSATSIDASIDPYSGSFDGLGGGAATGGVFGGYNQQIGDFVLSLEGGVYMNTGRLKYTVDSVGEMDITGSSFYALRGRAGVILNPSTMIYGLGGWVHADGAVDVTEFSSPTHMALSRSGVEFGGGIETWINQQLSMRAQYTYDVFDNGIPDSGPVNFRSRVGTAMLGAVFHLGNN